MVINNFDIFHASPGPTSLPSNTRTELKLIRRMLGQDAPSFENGINASKYQNLTRCSKATATRDLQHLVAHGVLAPVHSKGRYARYKLNF